MVKELSFAALSMAHTSAGWIIRRKTMTSVNERVKQEVNNHRADSYRVDDINYNYNRVIIAVCCLGFGFMIGYWLNPVFQGWLS